MKPKNTKKGQLYPRPWTPKNPEKYEGDPTGIIVRSSWEVRFLNWCDMNKHIVSYSSEEIVIPYLSPIDNKYHRYFPDAKIRLDTGQIYIVEIKPFYQCQKPTTKNKKRYLVEAQTYLINNSKWKYAKEFCSKRGWKFKVITEYELGLKKKNG